MPDPSSRFAAFIAELQRISGLTVISRNSVMYYKDKDIRTPEIARQLKVDALVEGSVFRAGDQVRIIAQLIHGASDEHMWSNDYEGDLTDILSLHSDVAGLLTGLFKPITSATPFEWMAPEVHQSVPKHNYSNL